VAVAIDVLNQAGEDSEEATMRQNYQNIKIKTCMPIEEQALNILTPYDFDLFQKELIHQLNLRSLNHQAEIILSDTGCRMR